jgi:hypothetical protein
MPNLGIGIGLGGALINKSAWSPISLGTKLKAWYDAGTADASPINTLSSRNGTLPLTAASTNRPTVSAGGILFDQVNDQMVGASAADWKFLHDGTGCVVCAVWAKAASGTQVLWSTEDVTNHAGAELTFYTGTEPSVTPNFKVNNNGAAIVNLSAGSSLAIGAKHLITCAYDESSSPKARLRLDLSDIATGASSGTPDSGNPQGALTLGGRVGIPTGFPLSGSVYELAVCTTLTAAELSQLENYFRSKWGTP